MSPVRIGIDQGTTGTRVVAFDETLSVVADAYRPVPSHHPHPGWVEKDADAVVTSVQEAVAELVTSVGARAISATGLDNEGETVVAWDADTLRPLAPAIVWSCRRSEPIVERLRAEGAEERVRELAGTSLNAYFTSTKITWLLENDADVQAAARAGRARFGTLDAYVLARLGDGARTEPSTAARTQLQALAAPGTWDPELCAIFGVDMDTLPPIGPSVGQLGSIAGLELTAMLVDQTAALAGHGCVAAGDTKATYGTGVFLLAHAGSEIPSDPAGLLPTVAWSTPEATAYALDGGVFSAGAAITWLRDSLGLIDERRGDRSTGAIGARHLRGQVPAGADRPGRTVVAVGCARDLARYDRPHNPRTPRAGGARIAHAAGTRHRRGTRQGGYPSRADPRRWRA